METVHLPEVLVLEFDGSCNPTNPGGTATYGWVIADEHNAVLLQGNGVAGEGEGWTNNLAEYRALEEGLRVLVDLGWQGRLTIWGDSQLVVRTVTGQWQRHAVHIRLASQLCEDLMERLATPEGELPVLKWRSREQNKRADRLASEAYARHVGRAPKAGDRKKGRKKWRKHVRSRKGG